MSGPLSPSLHFKQCYYGFQLKTRVSWDILVNRHMMPNNRILKAVSVRPCITCNQFVSYDPATKSWTGIVMAKTSHTTPVPLSACSGELLRLSLSTIIQLCCGKPVIHNRLILQIATTNQKQATSYNKWNHTYLLILSYH